MKTKVMGLFMAAIALGGGVSGFVIGRSTAPPASECWTEASFRSKPEDANTGEFHRQPVIQQEGKGY